MFPSIDHPSLLQGLYVQQALEKSYNYFHMEYPFQSLLERYLTGSLSPKERQAFLDMIAIGQHDQALDNCIDQALQQNLYEGQEVQEMKESIYQQLLQSMNERPVEERTPIPLIRRYWWAVAAVLLLSMGSVFYYFFAGDDRSKNLAGNDTGVQIDVAPGKDGAILTLADGRKVVLDSLGNGVVATQSGIQVALKNGQLVYDQEQLNGMNMVYNTMSTPKGRQFKLRLPDGTQVWLNSASTIRFPISFTGNQRIVSVTGEAYFEVAKVVSPERSRNPERSRRVPFLVQLDNGAAIEVLGTHFNVSAYKDEQSINTTLLEGSVRVVNRGSGNVNLRPGQQAQIIRNNNQPGPAIKIVNEVDIDKVMAWKNGAFNFENTSLEEVMRQLSRWYDIEIVYQKGIPAIEFEGKLSRNITLAGLLKVLEKTEVHFRLEENRKLVVLP